MPTSRKPKKEATPRVAPMPAGVARKVKPNKTRLTIGVTKVQQPSARLAGPRKKRLLAYSAAEASALFGTRAGKGGGPAFAAWCRTKGIDPMERRTQADWEPILEEFAARPIHGHRRTAAGGSHRPNPQHLRKR